MNGKNKINKNKRRSKRPIDQLTAGLYSWLGRSFILVSKTRIKTWQGLLAIAFIAGAMVAVILAVNYNIQTKSGAANTGTATLSWNPNAEADLAGYRIYYGTSKRTSSCPSGGLAGYQNKVGAGKVNSYTVGSLTEGQTYYFSITAYDASGNESCFSSEVSKVIPAPTPADTTPPSIPASLAATAVSSTQINLSWAASTDNIGVAGYKVYRNGTQITTTPNPSYSDTGLTPSTAYTYAVSAYDAAGNNSSQSGSVSATTLPSSSLTCDKVGSNNFQGCYFDNIDFTNLKVTRADSKMNFDWSSGSPDPAISPDTFSARWQGDWNFSSAGIYRFTATADDGVRVWVDGNLIIDKWIDQAAKTYTADKSLSAGTHRVKVEYYENGGLAVMKLSWAPAPCSTCALGLVGYWKFDETSGTTANDSSGNSLKGTLANGPAWISGKLKGALSFDGSNDYVSVASSPLLNNLKTFTYSAWIYPTGWGESNYGRVFSKESSSGTDEAYFLVMGNTSEKTFGGRVYNTAGTRFDSTSAVNSIGLNQWQHIVMTYNDSGDRVIHLYLNGKEVTYASKMTVSGTLKLTSNPFVIGNQKSSNRTFQGKLDDVRIFNRALSSSEIQELYNYTY